VGHGKVRKNAGCFAVLGDESEAGCDGIGGRGEVGRLAAEHDRTARRRVESEDAAGDCRSPGTDQAGEPQDFPAVQLEGNVPVFFDVRQAGHREALEIADERRAALRSGRFANVPTGATAIQLTNPTPSSRTFSGATY